MKNKTKIKAKCMVDGRWHMTSYIVDSDPEAVMFAHCVPKECAAKVTTTVANGSVVCNPNLGYPSSEGWVGQVGATCKIECDQFYRLDYDEDASQWDRQKPLLSEIECLFDQ